MRLRLAIVTTVMPLLGCAATPGERGVQAETSASEVREFYAAYEAAIKAHRRPELATFYRPDRATVVLNGVRMDLTNADIDGFYRGQWQGPVFFAFDSLRSEPLAEDQWLVTGGFRWLAPESADTGQFIYLSILDRTSEGFKIRVEHETQRPAPQR